MGFLLSLAFFCTFLYTQFSPQHLSSKAPISFSQPHHCFLRDVFLDTVAGPHHFLLCFYEFFMLSILTKFGFLLFISIRNIFFKKISSICLFFSGYKELGFIFKTFCLCFLSPLLLNIHTFFCALSNPIALFLFLIINTALLPSFFPTLEFSYLNL